MYDELFGYLDKNIIKSEHSLYNYVVYDSKVESKFASRLENDPDVELYIKLPEWFKINTPIGNYNPDWAIMFKEDIELHSLYFVVETKWSIDWENLRQNEKNKIKCGKKHFAALTKNRENIKYELASNYDDFKAKVE